ncbi:hypothetical protein CIRMBP1270_01688 [Enterococcus cecorum]|nr:hypothetical protein CIRMBP1303_00277 [Enterococcus cecorum]CAI3404861.1 hypothetical protein CIRMBP1270_01688 [Enterococcus cecorum]CAI3411079.1 hypothetical protein CIRMBP1244_01675 [Enterococcus cecorum]CAI3458933.1 hypothetical protein CIRMBP1207_02213 [Enterococcus cecorum]CAI3473344.1 hypothetical protein CIRMBP1300_01735 [Enterococcus cecorum]
MKMIEVLNMMAEGEIKEGSKLKIGGNTYSYIDTYTDDDGYCSFVNEEGYSDTFLEDEEMITQHFLNLEVEMIPPKEKKYLVKFNMRGLKENYRYLNYIESDECAHINDKRCTTIDKTHFTKSELQSIRSVREFLEDMQGKFKLIEVEDNEID